MKERIIKGNLLKKKDRIRFSLVLMFIFVLSMELGACGGDKNIDSGTEPLAEKEVVKPEPEQSGAGYGEFDFVDKDGYSYHVVYDLNPTITKDTTEGKPGDVGMVLNFSKCKITITNTTQGKTASFIAYFAATPLYAALVDFDDDASFNVGWAVFNQPIKNPEGDWDKISENKGVNEFSFSLPDSQRYVSLGDTGGWAFSLFYYDKSLHDFEVAESREYTAINRHITAEVGENEYANYMNIEGWAIYCDKVIYRGESLDNYVDSYILNNRSYYSADTSYYGGYFGQKGLSSLLVYNPIHD